MSARAYAHAFVALLVAAVMASVATADIITVCWDGSGDYLTIQEGIDADLAGVEVVVCAAIYTGPGDKHLGFGGKAITVRSENGPENCLMDSTDDRRGFWLQSAETSLATVDSLTVMKGPVITRMRTACQALVFDQLQYVFDKLEWKGERYDGYRVVLPFPAIRALVVTMHALPEAPRGRRGVMSVRLLRGEIPHKAGPALRDKSLCLRELNRA